MKFYRNAIILVAVLGLLVGACFIFNNIKTKNSQPSPETNTSNIIKILEADRDKVADVTIINKSGKFVITKKDEDFILSYPQDLKYNKDTINGVISNVLFIMADKVVEENATNLEQYGLNDPDVIAVKMTDGKVKTIELGDETSTKGGFYAREKDGKKIYIIGSYTVEKINISRNSIKDTVLFTVKPEDVVSFSMEKEGKPYFSVKRDDTSWLLTAPIEGKAESPSIETMIKALVESIASEFVEENPADLDKYGLQVPACAMEIITSKGDKSKLLLGTEKENDAISYAKMAGGSDVFTMNTSTFNFLDMPMKEILEAFAYIVNINEVNKIVVEIDGKVITCGIVTNKDDSSKDKFTVDGKDASMKDEDDNQPFRKFYQALIGVALSDVEIGAVPAGKPEITFTYHIKQAPGIVKVEFIPKNDGYYYVVKNGKYSNIIVSKKIFDEADGVRETYKRLVEYMNK